MTRKQMLARIRKLGGLNKKTAIQASKEKWQNLHKYWDEMQESRKLSFFLQDSQTHLPGTGNCALCELYYAEPKKICPLNILHKDKCIGECNENYLPAMDAIVDNDYNAFKKAADALVQALDEI